MEDGRGKLQGKADRNFIYRTSEPFFELAAFLMCSLYNKVKLKALLLSTYVLLFRSTNDATLRKASTNDQKDMTASMRARERKSQKYV